MCSNINTETNFITTLLEKKQPNIIDRDIIKNLKMLLFTDNNKQSNYDTFNYFKEFLLPIKKTKNTPVWWSGFYVEYKDKNNNFVHNEKLKQFTNQCIGDNYYTTQDCLLYDNIFMNKHIDVLNKKSKCGEVSKNWGFSKEISRAFTTNALENLLENTINYICNIPSKNFKTSYFYTTELPLIFQHFKTESFKLIIHNLNEPEYNMYRYKPENENEKDYIQEYLTCVFLKDIFSVLIKNEVENGSISDFLVEVNLEEVNDINNAICNYKKFICTFTNRINSDLEKNIKKNRKKL